MWKVHHRQKLLAAPLPTDWRRILEEQSPFYHRLPETDRQELDGLINVFLDEKIFEGCAEQLITDETRIAIAAQACLLLLHRSTDYFPGLRTILVYPSSYLVNTTRHIGSGVMEEFMQGRSGESWPAGAVVLAWDEVRRGTWVSGPHNLVLHEFAHQLDFENGGNADGVPALGAGESIISRHNIYTDWSRVMGIEYEQLRNRVQNGETTLLRAYGATNPAEFFAVATEIFFGMPDALKQQHPALYDQFQRYYRQDPSQWLPVTPVT